MEMQTPDQIRHARNMKKKRIVGILLVIAIAYFIFSNFELGWPSGFAVKEEGDSCIETKGPSYLTDTIVGPLDIEETGFKVMINERKAVLNIQNNDNVTGRVRVIVFCINGDEQGEQRKSIDPGEEMVYNFLDVDDCDLDYYIDPETVARKVNRSVEGEDVECG
jgi:hypothetical protein